MIKIVLLANKDHVVSLKISGHANAGNKGQDLVCAGVSACAIGALNALENSDNYQIKVEEGLISVNFNNADTPHDQVVIETLMMQLETIDVSNPRRLDIEKKERK